MKKRFNWNFAVIILICLLLLAAALVGSWRWHKKQNAEEGLCLGQQAYQKRQWEKAAINFGDYIAQHPHDVDILLKFADAQTKVRPLHPKNIQQAIAAYKTITRDDINNWDAVVPLVELYLQIQQPAEAENTARKALKAKEDPKLRSLLALALIRQRNFEDAYNQLKSVIDQSPNYILAYEMLGQLVEDQPDLFPKDSVEYWYQQAVKINPSSVQALLTRAAYYLRKQQTNLAAADVEHAESYNPTDPDLMVRLAGFLIHLGQTEKAKDYLTRAAELDPQNIDVWNAWAVLAQSCQDKQMMVQVADNALDALQGQQWDFMLKAIELYIQAGKIAKAQQLIDQMQKKQVSPPSLLFYEGVIAEMDGRPYQAIEKWQQAIDQKYEPARLHLALTRTLAKTGDVFAAIQQLRTAITEYPQNEDLNLELTRLLIRNNDITDAIGQARKTRQLAPHRLDVLMLYYQAAIASLEKQNTPPDSPAWKKINDDLQTLQKQFPQAVGIPMMQFQLALQKRQYPQAETILTDLKKQYPDNIQIAMAEVELLNDQQRNEDAENLLKTLISKFPQDQAPVKALAIMLANSNPEQAQEVLDQAKQRIDDPESKKELSLMLVTMYRLQKHDDRAISLLYQLDKKYPNDILIKSSLLKSKEILADPEKAQSIIDQIKSIEGLQGRIWRIEQARLWLTQADRMKQKVPDNYSQIVTLLNENLKQFPGDLESIILLANAHKMAGEWNLAVTAYQEAYLHDSDNLAVIIPLIGALQRTGRYQQAESIIQTATRKKLSHPMLSRFQLKQAMMTGQWQGSISILEELLKADPKNQKLLLMLASLKTQNGQLDDAENILDNMIRETPDSIPVAAAMIDLRIRQGRPNQATDIADRLVQKQENDDAWLIKAGTHARLGQVDQALAAYSHAITLNPDNIEAYLYLAEFLRGHGKTDDAVHILQQALDRQPDNLQLQKQAVALFLTDPREDIVKQGRLLLEKALKNHPHDDDLKLLNARRLLAVQTAPNIDQAVVILKEITDSSPNLVQPWLILSEIDLNAKQQQDALDMIIKGLAAVPDNKDLLLAKVRIEKEREPSRAVETLNKLRQLYPDDINIVLQLADAYLLNNHSDKAISLLKQYDAVEIPAERNNIRIALLAAKYKKGLKADAIKELLAIVEENPRKHQSIITLVHLLKADRQWNQLRKILLDNTGNNENRQWLTAIAGELSGDQDPQAKKIAVAVLQSLVEKKDRQVEPLLILAILQVQDNQIDQAETNYRKILEMNPHRPEACNNLAWILSEKRQQYPQALKIIEQGIAKAPPAYIDIIDTRGMIYYHMADYQKALQDFQTCARLYPSYASGRAGALYHLALTQMQLNQKSDALRSFKNALEIHRQIGGLSDDQTDDANQWIKKLSEGVK